MRIQQRIDPQTGEQSYYLTERGVDNEWAPSNLREVTCFEDGYPKITLNLRANPPGTWTSGIRMEYAGWNNGQITGSVYQVWSQALQD